MWKKYYINALIDALNPTGDVLQVGFEQGFAAERIQTYKPKSHTIIEKDPTLFDKAQEWASHHQRIAVIPESWGEILPKLGTFDAIFYDEYAEVEKLREHQQTGAALLRQGEALAQMVKKQVPHLTTIRYSDNDLEDFYQNVGKLQPREFARFLSELHYHDQISYEQYEAMIGKHHLERIPFHVRLPIKQIDPALIFLEACFDSHMRSGSRFTCFSPDSTSKFEDPLYFERIITNPHVDYSETRFPIHDDQDALIILVEKL